MGTKQLLCDRPLFALDGSQTGSAGAGFRMCCCAARHWLDGQRCGGIGSPGAWGNGASLKKPYNGRRPSGHGHDGDKAARMGTASLSLKSKPGLKFEGWSLPEAERDSQRLPPSHYNNTILRFI